MLVVARAVASTLSCAAELYMSRDIRSDGTDASAAAGARDVEGLSYYRLCARVIRFVVTPTVEMYDCNKYVSDVHA